MGGGTRPRDQVWLKPLLPPLPHYKLMRRSSGAGLEIQEDYQEKLRGGQEEVC